MQTIAITSGSGGVGRTTVTANLAAVLAQRGQRVLVVDFDPQNAQRLLLGMDPQQIEGLAREGVNAQAIFDSPFGGLLANPVAATAVHQAVNPERSPAAGAAASPPSHPDADAATTGLRFIPFGQLLDEDLEIFADDLTRDPCWLRDHLLPLRELGFDLILIDTPSGPSPFLDQALRAADLAVVVVRADVASCLSLPAIESSIQRCNGARSDFRGGYRLINALPINNRLAHEVRKTLMADGAQQLVPLSIHLDPAVGQAFAHARPVIDFRPGTSASLDFHYLGDWLLDTLDDE